MKRSISGTALVLLLGSGLTHAQDRPPAYPPEMLQNGARLYQAACAACHGMTGDLVPSVDLRSGRFRHATSDEELGRVISAGIPGTAMPPNRFDPAELTALVAFLRSMRDFNTRPVAAGDAGRGQALFAGKGGCASCHRVNESGSRTGPDLSDVGVFRSPESLERSLLDPTAAMRPINRPVRAVLRDGKVVSGRRLNEDTYTVQLIDDQERLRSLVKADLREYTVMKTSPMPSYKDRLSPQERADLVAYLASLRGVRTR